MYIHVHGIRYMYDNMAMHINTHTSSPPDSLLKTAKLIPEVYTCLKLNLEEICTINNTSYQTASEGMEPRVLRCRAQYVQVKRIRVGNCGWEGIPIMDTFAHEMAKRLQLT